MSSGVSRSFKGQVAVAAIGLTALAFWPPDVGTMLLVPLDGADINASARIALSGGALLLGPGPLPGSLVVVGERARIARRAGVPTLLIVAAPPAWCGSPGASWRTA